MEETWRTEASQLKELLAEKDKEISRANKKREARSRAHADALALLSSTQSALEKSKLTSDAVVEELRKQLAEKEESRQKELSEQWEAMKKELSERADSFQEEHCSGREKRESWRRCCS